MKKFTKSEKPKLELQDNTINYISAADIDKYLEIAGKCISDDAKEICKWLKVNNENYLHDLDPKNTADNALAHFYNQGVPEDTALRELYGCIGRIMKIGRILEIPVFQTEEQFTAIINKTVSPDEILLDLETDAGRDAVFKKYQPLLYKIVNQFVGKSDLPYDELYSVACLGFVNAMNSFGHAKRRDENGKWVEIPKEEQHTNYTFGQYVGNQMRNQILGAIEDSHIVRVPKSQQKRERDEQGYNKRQNHVSGDKTIGHDSEGKNKTLFDYIEDSTDGDTIKMDNEDIDKFLADAYKHIEDEFGKEDFEMFCRAFKVNGYGDEVKNQKELAAEYGLKPTTFNVRLHKILSFCMKDPRLKDIFDNIRELMAECRQIAYEEEDMYFEERKVNPNLYNEEY